jgi:tetratricopeptide (TPR) repeat protein
MFDSRIPKTVILCIDHTASLENRKIFIERIQAILPQLNWRTHFSLVSEGLPNGLVFAQEIIDALAQFVTENRFVTFYVHPLIRIGAPNRADSLRWKKLLHGMRPFQQQAYDQQSEARLLILPILEPAAGTADEHWIQAAQFFRVNFAKPSVVLRGSRALGKAREAAGQGIRFYLEPDETSGPGGVVRQLWMNHVFEDLLERVKETDSAPDAGAGGNLLLPCRTHRVIDQQSGNVYSCFHDWSIGRPLCATESIFGSGERITGSSKADACAGCIGRSLRSMTDNLAANDSLAEGRKVHFQLALAFSGSRRYGEAIEHAARARHLSSTEADRAGASILKGLCHLGLGEFEEAERSLKETASSADDPGLVSFHRGRVQFEWRDYIEALDRFEEALASGSKAVPAIDLYYYMAVSHLHIGEYPKARSYLDRWRETGQRPATMLYYRGLCDIGEGRLESALSELRAAQQADPAEEDMANLLFYTGFCLKELGRYWEAIPVLERAAAYDPKEIGTFNLLGFCFYKTARHAEAVDCFRRAIDLDPGSAIDHANLATNLKELGRIEEAIAIYRKALSLDPSIGFARDNLQKLTRGPDEQGD